MRGLWSVGVIILRCPQCGVFALVLSHRDLIVDGGVLSGTGLCAGCGAGVMTVLPKKGSGGVFPRYGEWN